MDFMSYFSDLKNSFTKIKFTPSGKKNPLDYFTFFYIELFNIAKNRIIYENLPSDFMLNSQLIEQFFIESNFVVFQKLENRLKMYKAEMSDGKKNIYGLPFKGRAYSLNGVTFNFEVNDEDVVLCYNSLMYENTFQVIDFYAHLLNDIIKALIVSINNQKNPRILAVPKNGIMTATNLFEQIDIGVPVIYLKDTCEISAIKEFDLSNNYNCDKLFDLFKNIFTQALNRLGIEGYENDSRERLTAGEVNSNDNFIEFNRNELLNNRLYNFSLVNEKFGYNIIPKFNSNLKTAVNNSSILNVANFLKQEVKENE